MIVADIVRNENFTTTANIEPFVYAGYTKYFDFKDEWTDDVNDIFDTSERLKCLQMTQGYLNKHSKENNLADCENQPTSFYFDTLSQILYFNLQHEYSPITSPIDYGYAIGVCAESLGDVYINDIFYEACIKDDDLTISRSADALGLSQPKGSTSSLSINNEGRKDETTNTRRGIMDILFSENIYHNDVYIYDYVSGALEQKAVYFIEDFSMTMQNVTLNLQDKRFQ